MKRESLFLSGIALLALSLRLVAIHSRGIWYDDAFSFFLAQRSLAEIVAGTAADTMPPLYYFLLHYWMIVSRELWWLRLLSVLLSMGVFFLEYFWITRLFGLTAGRWAALVTAISPFHIYHAQELRMYALLVLCQLGYAWFFTSLWQAFRQGQKGGFRDWLGLVVCGAMAMYSHNLAIFALVVPFLFLLAQRQWGLLIRWLIALGIIGLIALPWLDMVPGQIGKIQRAFWTPRPGLVQILQAIAEFTGSLPLPSLATGIVLILSVQILVVVILETSREQRKREEAGLLTSFALIPPVLLFLVSYVMRPVFVPRGFFISLLAYTGLIGWVIAKSRPKGVGTFLAVSLVVTAAISLPYQYTFHSFPRSPYREAVDYLKTVAVAGDLVVHDNKLSYFPSAYYAPDLPQVFIADAPGTHNDTLAAASQEAMKIYPEPSLEVAVGNHPRIYFVVFTQTFDEYREMGEPDHPSLSWLKSHYHLSDHHRFNDLEVYRFDR